MNEIINAIRQFFDYFRLWVIVSPWERALRVRLGKHVSILGPGIHFRFSLIDSIFCQSIRMRICGLGRQTISSKDGKTITFTASIGYSIQDVGLLYNTLHHAEDTISNMARAAVADYISTHDLCDCHPEIVQKALNGSLNFSAYGLSSAKVYLTEFATVRTYRLIGDYGGGTMGSSLSVESPTAGMNAPAPR